MKVCIGIRVIPLCSLYHEIYYGSLDMEEELSCNMINIIELTVKLKLPIFGNLTDELMLSMLGTKAIRHD